MVERGMMPMAAIQAATTGAAEFLSWKDKVNQLTQGHFAALIAVRDDPVANIRTLENVPFVVKGGACSTRTR